MSTSPAGCSEALDDFVPPQASGGEPLLVFPHNPSQRQQQFLALDCLEAFYGGAAGGGRVKHCSWRRCSM